MYLHNMAPTFENCTVFQFLSILLPISPSSSTSLLSIFFLYFHILHPVSAKVSGGALKLPSQRVRMDRARPPNDIMTKWITHISFPVGTRVSNHPRGLRLRPSPHSTSHLVTDMQQWQADYATPGLSNRSLLGLLNTANLLFDIPYVILFNFPRV